MAYNPYTSQQINDFIGQKGIANDPWAMYNFRQQYNVDPAALDAARGWGAGTSQSFMDQAQKTLSGPVAGMRELDATNPHMAYALAQQRGYTPGQTDTLYDMGAGTAAGWAQQQGLTGFGSPQPAGGAVMPPISGTPGPANNSPASPYAAPSTAGSTPVTMTGGGNGTVGTPDYMVAAPSGNPYGQGGRQRNPYMPAGGAGSNFGNDPRIGGPGGRPSGLAGLSRYLSDNPHMLAMGNEITRGVNNNLQRNILPAIGDQFSGSGTYGGSRHGVAEGLAVGESMSGLAGALANLYGNQFNTDRGYGLQSDALDFNIHQGNAATMRQGQLDQLSAMGQIGAMNQQGIGAATQARDRPFTDWQRFVGPASQMAGLGNTQTQNLQGNPWLSAIGGALAGYKAFGG